MMCIGTAFPDRQEFAGGFLLSCLPGHLTKMENGVADQTGKKKGGSDDLQLPEIWAYLGVLVQVRRCLSPESKDARLMGAGVSLRLCLLQRRFRLQ